MVLRAVSLPEVAATVGQLPFRSGRSYSTARGARTTSGAVPAANTLYAYPWQLYRPFTLAELSLRVVTGGAGSSVKAGVWAAHPATGLPNGAPLAVNNTGASTATSTSTATLAMSAVLPPGLYWVGSALTGTMPTTLSISNASGEIAALIGAADPAGAGPVGLSTPHTYASDLPSFAGSETWTDVTAAGAPLFLAKHA